MYFLPGFIVSSLKVLEVDIFWDLGVIRLIVRDPILRVTLKEGILSAGV